MKTEGQELRKIVSSYVEFGLGTSLFVSLRSCFFPYFELLESYLPDKGDIVDLGCGHGVFTNLIAMKSPHRQVIGIDPLEDRIEAARRVAKVNRIENVSFRKEWLGNFNLEGYQAITIIDVIYYLPFKDQKELLERCYRGLDQGGIFIIKDTSRKPTWKYGLFYLEEALKTRFKMVFGSPTWSKIFRGKFFVRGSDEFRQLLENERFATQAIHLDGWGYQPHVAFLCRRG